MTNPPEWKDESFDGCEDNWHTPSKEPVHEWELTGYSPNKQLFICNLCKVFHTVEEDNPKTWLRNISRYC